MSLVETLFAQGITIPQAAKVLGISPDALQNFLTMHGQRWSEFQMQFKQALVNRLNLALYGMTNEVVRRSLDRERLDEMKDTDLLAYLRTLTEKRGSLAGDSEGHLAARAQLQTANILAQLVANHHERLGIADVQVHRITPNVEVPDAEFEVREEPTVAESPPPPNKWLD